MPRNASRLCSKPVQPTPFLPTCQHKQVPRPLHQKQPQARCMHATDGQATRSDDSKAPLCIRSKNCRVNAAEEMVVKRHARWHRKPRHSTPASQTPASDAASAHNIKSTTSQHPDGVAADVPSATCQHTCPEKRAFASPCRYP